MGALTEDLLAAVPASDEEARFIKNYGHRSLCNCVRRFRGRDIIAAAVRHCTCREFLESQRLHKEDRARVAALPSNREQGATTERERLRPLLEKCEAIVQAQLRLNQGLRRPDGEAGALLGNLLAALRAELGKETS